MTPGPRNLITDVAGIKVGNAEDLNLLSGVTVVLPDDPAVAAADMRGGGPATRETDALDASCLVDAIHGVVLSGGSVFGLEAASGAVDWLDGQGRGFAFGAQPHVSPVVPAAALFDITNGGDKDWDDAPPYRGLGRAACEAAGADFALGNAGAGTGALAGSCKGGLGSASVQSGGITVGALMAVNSFGSAVVPGTGTLWAEPFALDGEFGGAGDLRLSRSEAALSLDAGTKAELARGDDAAGRNTTIGVVATDAALTPAEAKRLAIMAARRHGPRHPPHPHPVRRRRHLRAVDRKSRARRPPPARPDAGRRHGGGHRRPAPSAAPSGRAETVGGWRSFRDTHGV